MTTTLVPLTATADFNPGDIVRFRGKKWRVQGIDDYRKLLLLLDVAEPEDAPDFVDAYFPVTRGSNRRPEYMRHRWRWASANDVELA